MAKRKTNGKISSENILPVPEKPSAKYINQITPEVQRRAQEIANEIKSIVENFQYMTAEQKEMEKAHILRLKKTIELMGLNLCYKVKKKFSDDGRLEKMIIEIIIEKPKKPN